MQLGPAAPSRRGKGGMTEVVKDQTGGAISPTSPPKTNAQPGDLAPASDPAVVATLGAAVTPAAEVTSAPVAKSDAAGTAGAVAKSGAADNTGAVTKSGAAGTTGPAAKSGAATDPDAAAGATPIEPNPHPHRASMGSASQADTERRGSQSSQVGLDLAAPGGTAGNDKGGTPPPVAKPSPLVAEPIGWGM